MTGIEFGSWRSEIGARRVAESGCRLSQPRIDAGFLYWLEGRPEQGGRQQLMRVALRGGRAPEPATPTDINVRTRVHEYGGGDYLARGGRLAYVDYADQCLYVSGPKGFARLSPVGSRYADFDLHPGGRWLVAVEERLREPAEAENALVAFPLPGPGENVRPTRPLRVAGGHDFYSFPGFSPDGRRLVFTCWDHPDMPWDRTRLCGLAWSADGKAGDVLEFVGRDRVESIFQPTFSAGGLLSFVSDRDGWWNLYLLSAAGAARPLCPRAAEFGWPQWVFGLSSHAWLGERTLLCVRSEEGRERLARLAIDSGRLDDLDLPYVGYAGLRVAEGHACFVATSAQHSAVVATLDLETGALCERASAASAEIDPVLVQVPEAFEFESAAGRRAHALFYAPHNPARVRRPTGRPPLLVKSHGGPTSAASPALDPRIQFWTSRGFAVVDVDYSGSSGYGRAYREQLYGQWGVADVEDCIEAARALVRAGRVDEHALAISGGSAGGYTTLCALTFHDVFAVGASHYGIGDLEALARDTHKFESRYLEHLIGPYPERRDLYRERSPVHFAERLCCPIIFFQGLEDEVVPPAQAEAMVAALAARGIAHAYVPFAGEQHGFRRAENIRAALEGELYFYSRVLGFDVDRRPPKGSIRGF